MAMKYFVVYPNQRKIFLLRKPTCNPLLCTKIFQHVFILLSFNTLKHSEKKHLSMDLGVNGYIFRRICVTKGWEGYKLLRRK